MASASALLAAILLLAPATPVSPLTQSGLTPRLGERVPLDVPVVDETGREARLGDCLVAGKPAILALVYFRCPMLCNLVLEGTKSAMKGVSYAPGTDFTMLALSFDALDSAESGTAKREAYDPRWRFLTAPTPTVDAVTRAVGFRYAFDESIGEYAHPAVLAVLTPDGRIARYLYGIEYAPRDVRLALVEASEGKIGTVVDRALLLCYRYDPARGKYGAVVMGSVRAGGALTLVALFGLLWRLGRRDRGGRKPC